MKGRELQPALHIDRTERPALSFRPLAGAWALTRSICPSMERLLFAPDAAFIPRDDLLDGVTVAPLTARPESRNPVKAAIFRLAPNGRLRRHPATLPQILAVLEGSGRVSGSDGEFQPIGPGEAVFWVAGEEHETETDTGLTALILEADGLQPWRTGS
jgi:quercetin dioxygenase-like cupin family protein